MNNSQRSRLDSCHRVKDVCQANVVALSPIPDYATEKDILDDAIGKTEVAVGLQTVPFGGESEASQLAKTAMAKTIVKFCLRGAYKARRAGNFTLAAALEFPLTDLIKSPKAESVQRARAAMNAISLNLGLLTNISLSDVSAMASTINAYDTIKDRPTEARESKKADGTDIIELELERADEAKYFILALADSYLSESNHALFEKLKLAGQIISTGIHHTEVEFNFRNQNGSPAYQVTVDDLSNGKRYAAGNSSQVILLSHFSGNFHFRLTAPGKQILDFAAQIHRGQHNVFTVIMAAE